MLKGANLSIVSDCDQELLDLRDNDIIKNGFFLHLLIEKEIIILGDWYQIILK